MAMAYPTLINGLKTKTAIAAKADEIEKLQMALWWMKQDFTQVVSRGIRDELGSTEASFIGREDLGVKFTRVAKIPTVAAMGSLLRVEYFLDEGRLTRRVWGAVDRTNGTEKYDTVLLDNVKSWKLRYLSDNVWFFGWPTSGNLLSNTAESLTLPKVVEVKMELENLGSILKYYELPDGLPNRVIQK